MDELVGEQYEVACQQSQQVSEQTEQISQQSGVVGEQAEAFSHQSERLIFLPIQFSYILHIKSYHRTRFRVPNFFCGFGNGVAARKIFRRGHV